ncbi:hypothetical protein Y032_0231g3019 [Ancylostoma ceylanicum]|uniref:Uncharacterized protein n=1 Tax=Ancylostoma ceylanicum TaxID=53326 RepID=A0A016SFZ6_9BILA|nr:hypothetical protein Y032_0231g3019 [Ancylostoma ceylanicum]
MRAPSLLSLITTFGCVYMVTYVVLIDKTDTTPLLRLAKKTILKEPETSTDNADLFDYCPFEVPDPWHESIAQYVDVKYGFKADCPSKEDLEPITEVDSGNVKLKQRYKKFKCKARCLFYKSDRKYNSSEWKDIAQSKFLCDFIETDCKFQNIRRRFIHIRIEEKKWPEEMPVLNREIYPDVHLIVLDSVASTHFVRRSLQSASTVRVSEHLRSFIAYLSPISTTNPLSATYKITEQFLKSPSKATSTQKFRAHIEHVCIIKALPRTANFLVNGMGAVQFWRLNRVGWNSRPNGFATLLGKTTEPLVRVLPELQTIEPDLSQTELCSKYLDNESYIPLEYRRAGYKTLDAQDYSASILHFPRCLGLKNNILDHYYRPFRMRLREDKELANVHKKGRCRGSIDNILEFLGRYINSYEVEEIP